MSVQRVLWVALIAAGSFWLLKATGNESILS